MEERLTILKGLHDKRVTVTNKNLEIYGACLHKTTSESNQPQKTKPNRIICYLWIKIIERNEKLDQCGKYKKQQGKGDNVLLVFSALFIYLF